VFEVCKFNYLILRSQFVISSLEVPNWYLHFIPVGDIYLLILADPPGNRPGIFQWS